MTFRNREHAGELLAARLARYRGLRPLVLAIPRGAVPMARIVADALEGDLDVVLVRKLGAPGWPEFAVGSVSEGGDVIVAAHAAEVGADAAYLERETQAQLAVIRERRAKLAPVAPPADPLGRIVIVVDDGVATGSTLLAALESLRRRGPERLVAAVGVAPPGALDAIRRAADDVVCVESPPHFHAVGQFFEDFGPVSDEEVVETLRDFHRRRRDGAVEGAAAESGARPAAAPRPALEEHVEIPAGRVVLPGELSLPAGARALVLFAHGSGSSRFSPRNAFVARRLHRSGLGTLLLDLLTEEEDRTHETRFDIALLTRRLAAATDWAAAREDLADLPLGYFGASTGAACALRAAARLGDRVGAVVSRGGRPDLARAALARVRAPTLLVVGGDDHGVIELNESAYADLGCEKRLEIVPGATHLFEEEGALERVADLAARWFEGHLAAAAHASAPAG